MVVASCNRSHLEYYVRPPDQGAAEVGVWECLEHHDVLFPAHRTWSEPMRELRVDCLTGRVKDSQALEAFARLDDTELGNPGFRFEQLENETALRVVDPGGTPTVVPLPGEAWFEFGIMEEDRAFVFALTREWRGLLDDSLWWLWRLDVGERSWAKHPQPWAGAMPVELSASSSTRAHLGVSGWTTLQADMTVGDWREIGDGWFRPDAAGGLTEFIVSQRDGRFRIRRFARGKMEVMAEVGNRGAGCLKVFPVLGGRAHMLAYETAFDSGAWIVTRLDEKDQETVVIETEPFGW